MVIVTKNQYLLASKIHYITLNEQVHYIDVRNSSGRVISVKDSWFDLCIVYAPENVSTANLGTLRHNEDHRECNVRIKYAADAHKVFRDLIQQIREQMPDQLYLDTALERMITANDLKTLQEDTVEHMRIVKRKREHKRTRRLNDTSTRKVRSVRKEKRRSKKVLRRAK